MRKIIFLLVSILVVNNLFSQEFDEYTQKWSTYFGGQTTRFTTSVVDLDGNIIAAGEMLGGINEVLQDENYYNQFWSATNLSYDSLLVNVNGAGQSLIAKFSPDGELLQSGYLPFQVYDLKIDNEGNLYFWGTTKLDTIATQNVWFSAPASNTLPQKTVIAKLNPNFTLLWCTYIPTESFMDYCFDDSFNIYGIATTTIDSGITTANTFQSDFITVLNSQNKPYSNGLVFKLNNNGQLQWSSYYGVGISGYAIAYSNNDLITSFTRNTNDSNLSQYNNYYYTQNAYQQIPSDQIITKFNASNGQRTYSTYLDNLGIKDIVCNNNYYYFFGETAGNLTDSELITPNAYQPIFGGVYDMYLGKFDSNINPVWGTYIGGNSIELFNLGSQIRIKDKALYISFLSTSDNNFINGPNTYQSQPNGTNEQVMMKFSLSGNLIWGSFFGGSGSEMYSSIAPIDNNSFYLVGSTTSLNDISTTGSYQENLSIYPSYPNSNFGNGFITKFAPLNDLSVQEQDKNNFKIFPNPAKEKISIIGNLNKNFSINIYNSLGQIVLQEKADNNKVNTINLSNLQSGVYNLVITKNNKRIESHKLIIQ